jgi:glycosyltransferase involved in cell wall biosynthesis
MKYGAACRNSCVPAEPKRPLRVARILARLNVGGPTRHVVWLTSALEGPEFHTTLITGTVPPGEDDMSDFATRHGVEPRIVREMSRELSPRDVITIWKLYRIFRELQPDVIHTHTAKAGATGRLAGLLYRWLTPQTLLARPRRVRLVHTFHGHVFHSYYGALKTRLFITIEKVLAWWTDVIITITEQQRREIHETFGVGRASQFRVVRLGLDLSDCVGDENRGAARAAAGLREGDLAVGIVGRLTAIKNHELFLRVAASRAWPDPVRFVVYGDGADRAALEKRTREMNLESRVHFAGTRGAKEIYAALDIAALTSLNEGTPLTLIEAMTNGIPCISTSVGGVVDVLGDVEERITNTDGAVYELRERGITAASNDERGFAAGLSRLIADPALRERLAERGRTFARAAYSKQRLVADIIALYHELRA